MQTSKTGGMGIAGGTPRGGAGMPLNSSYGANLNNSYGANTAAKAASSNSNNLHNTLPPKAGAAKPAAAGGKKVTKESAISRAFNNEISEGRLDLSGRNLGDNQINEIARNLKTSGYMHELDLSNNKITDSGV